MQALERTELALTPEDERIALEHALEDERFAVIGHEGGVPTFGATVVIEKRLAEAAQGALPMLEEQATAEQRFDPAHAGLGAADACHIEFTDLEIETPMGGRAAILGGWRDSDRCGRRRG